MKILAWNCRGIGNDPTVRHLKDLIRKEKPYILFLSETLVSNDHVNIIRISRLFDNFVAVSSRKTSGGLSLFWNNNYSLAITSSCKHHINASITSGHKRTVWQATFFYGSPHHLKKERSWNILKRLKVENGVPWLIIGDLNIVLHQSEKQGGTTFDGRDVQFARDIIQQEGLVDLGFAGSPTTWDNGREDLANIKQRIDRGLGNADWVFLFPNANIYHLTAIESDHCPILLDSEPVHEKYLKPFKFQAMWTRHSSYPDIISKSWSLSYPIDSILNLITKLKKTKINLKKWNFEVFGNLGNNIKLVTEAIDTLQNLSPSKANLKEKKELEGKLEELLLCEEIFWQQKSRDKWIEAGEKNTKYFHASTVCRRKRNRIEWICDEFGDWFYTRKEIGAVLVDHFEKLLAPEDLSDREPCPIDLFPKIITDEDNEMLLKDIEDEEVTCASLVLNFLSFTQHANAIFAN
ncbi:hypothetical protein ACHQM5_030229 [Ranunculus cassubicifolius]